MNERIFFIVGAQRAGTSYLYEVLDQHPEICMARPLKPEPKFFLKSENCDLGIDYYLETFYKNRNSKSILGEKSTSYLERIDAGERMKEMFPQAKIIISLRNPVERALSNYYFSKLNGLETRIASDAFFGKSMPASYTTSVSPHLYMERGRYVEYIHSYYKIFGAENVRVLLFDRTIGNLAEISSLYKFIGANDSFVPTNIYEKINAGSEMESVSEEMRERMKDYFKSSNRDLENLLGYKIPEWT